MSQSREYPRTREHPAPAREHPETKETRENENELLETVVTLIIMGDLKGMFLEILIFSMFGTD